MSVKHKIIKYAIHSTPQVIKKWVINKKIKGAGKMIEFRFDPKKKELYAKALLSGEAEPIEFHVQDYRLVEEEGISSIVIEQFLTNREWLTTLLNAFIIGKEFPIPKDKVGLITELLQQK